MLEEILDDILNVLVGFAEEGPKVPVRRLAELDNIRTRITARATKRTLDAKESRRVLNSTLEALNGALKMCVSEPDVVNGLD